MTYVNNSDPDPQITVFGGDVQEGDRIRIFHCGREYYKTVTQTYSEGFHGERSIHFEDGTNLKPTDGATYEVLSV